MVSFKMYLQFYLNLDFQSIVVTLHVLFYCAGLHRLCLAFFTFIFLHDLMVTLHVFFYLVVLASVWHSLHLYPLFHHL